MTAARRVAAACLACLLVAVPAPAQTACGVERWQVKTLQDSDAWMVSLTPARASVDSLGRLPAPASRPEGARAAPAELRTFTVRALLVDAFGEADGDVHLILEDSTGATMNAEIPDPACAGASLFTRDFARARLELRTVQTGVVIDVTGVGFFDYLHGQKGHAPNGIELHPVLSIRRVR